jgi:hypothetical protein
MTGKDRTKTILAHKEADQVPYDLAGGGVDTLSTLNSGTPQAVKDELMKVLGILSPGGGLYLPLYIIFKTMHYPKISGPCGIPCRNTGNINYKQKNK